MPLSISLFLTINTICLLLMCSAAMFAPEQRVDKGTVFVLTLWLACSLFVTASAWDAYVN